MFGKWRKKPATGGEGAGDTGAVVTDTAASAPSPEAPMAAGYDAHAPMSPPSPRAASGKESGELQYTGQGGEPTRWKLPLLQVRISRERVASKAWRLSSSQAVLVRNTPPVATCSPVGFWLLAKNQGTRGGPCLDAGEQSWAL